jgi:hypothetical protein
MNATFSLSHSMFRFLIGAKTSASVDQAAKRAYMRVAQHYAQPNATLFTWRFLQEAGAGIVHDYIHGKLARHHAAEALAHAWHTDFGNISAQQRRYRLASTAMTADCFFMELTKELHPH